MRVVLHSSATGFRISAGRASRLWWFLFIALAALLFAMPAFALSSREEARINTMLAALEKQAGIVFIRNGSEHTAAEAASHLRLKLSKTRDRLDSAEQFIDKVASSSSLTGQPYLVREAGKGERPANAFLHELLKRAAPR